MAAHTHAVVKPSFWTGKTGKKLRAHPDAQRLALYLMTSPHRLMTGLYYVPKIIIHHELGLEIPEIDAAFKLLSSDSYEFAYYDDEADLVLVINLAAHQVGETLKGGEKPDRKIANVIKLISPYRTHPFYARFVDRYNLPFHLNLESLVGASMGLHEENKGLPKPLLLDLDLDPDLDPADAGDPLLEFAKSWRKLTGRSEFADYVDGCGQVGGTELQWLRDVRKVCGGSAVQFIARMTARLASDKGEFLLGQTLHHWLKGPLQRPVVAPVAAPHDSRKDGPRKGLGAYKILPRQS